MLGKVALGMAYILQAGRSRTETGAKAYISHDGRSRIQKGPKACQAED